MRMAAPGVYKLELEEQKRSVFVTQLHDREDDDETRLFPVVKESGDRLLETGVNTLQKTLLLKKEVEVDKVNAELDAKRYEFKQRMEMCAQRQAEVQKKQQQMKDRVEKFEKFIQENDMKRRRAIQKYQQEVKLREQKALEFVSLSEQLHHYKARHRILQAKVRKYKVYEEYLQNVIDALPEDYLPPTEDKIISLMMRHRTLSESNRGLLSNLDEMTDELEECKKTLEMMNQEHQQTRLSSTSQILHHQEMLEQVLDQNEQKEQNFLVNKDEKRAKVTVVHQQLEITYKDVDWKMEDKAHRAEVGVIFMALDNIYERCRRLTDPHKADWNHKLACIQEYVKEREDVLDIVKISSSPVAGQTASEKVKTKPKKNDGRILKFAVTDD